MREMLEESKGELKRADHLIYVSLKYTRTVDVIKSIIERLINAFNNGILVLLTYAEEKHMITSYPESPVQRCSMLKHVFKEQEDIPGYTEFYLFLRKLSRAEYTSHREYRRHVTMVAKVDGKEINVDIDTIHQYYEKAKAFVVFIEGLIGAETHD